MAQKHFSSWKCDFLNDALAKPQIKAESIAQILFDPNFG